MCWSGISCGPSSFSRCRWDCITSSNITSPSPEGANGVVSRDMLIPGYQQQYPEVPARFYEPADAAPDERLPVLVYLHGGGMCVCSEKDEQAHETVCELVRRLGCRAIGPGFRLAPEDPFPCALRDVYTVIRNLALSSGQRETGLPECDEIIVAGDSSGANLTLVVSLLALNKVDADRQPDEEAAAVILSKIKYNMLFYPTLYHAKKGKYIPDQPILMFPKALENFFDVAYLGDSENEDALMQDWRVAPMQAPSFAGLPTTLLVTADHCPLKDSNDLLEGKLKAANVRVYSKCPENTPHGFLTFPPFGTDSNAVESVWDWLEDILKLEGTPVPCA